MKKIDLFQIFLVVLTLISIPLSIWCIYGESWRLFLSREREAYLDSHNEFKKSTGPLSMRILADLNEAEKRPPYLPRIEENGGRWILYVRNEEGDIDQVSYFFRATDGIYRTSQEGQKTEIFHLSLKSMKISRVNEHTWELALFREVHTQFGYMGDDFLIYTFSTSAR